MNLVKSKTMALLTVCPAKLVPPPRGKIGMLKRFATSTTRITSSYERGITTPTGSI